MNSDVAHRGVLPLNMTAGKMAQSPKKLETFTYVLNVGIITTEVHSVSE